MPRKGINSDRSVTERVSKELFSLSKDVRYVAVYYHGKLQTVSKPDQGGSGWWDSDKYEELIVNPTLITLLRQRGNIDCGGIRHVVIQYGDFAQFVRPISGGHISIGFDPGSNVLRFLQKIEALLRREKLLMKHQSRNKE